MTGRRIALTVAGLALLAAALAAVPRLMTAVRDEPASDRDSLHADADAATGGLDEPDARSRDRRRVQSPNPTDERADAEVALQELRTELRERGAPLTVAEAEPPVPEDAFNGAVDIDRAHAWWDAAEREPYWPEKIAGAWNNTLRWPWWESATPEQMKRLGPFLESLAPFFEHLDRAARKPEIAWPHRTHGSAAEWLDTAVPAETTWLQLVTQLLGARSIAGATPEERLAGIRAQLALGVRYRARFVLGHLTANTRARNAAVRLRHCLEDGSIDPAAAREQLDEMLSVSPIARFSSLIEFERIYALEVLPYWVDGSMPAEIDRRHPERAARRAKKGKPPETAQDWIRWTRDLDRYDDLQWTSDAVRSGFSSYEAPLNQITIRLDPMLGHVVDAEAAMRLGRLALASYEFRREHGRWPDSAEDLSPLFPEGVPVDPFTGAAFLIGTDGEHLTLRAKHWEWMSRDEDDPRGDGDDWRLPPR